MARFYARPPAYGSGISLTIRNIINSSTCDFSHFKFFATGGICDSRMETSMTARTISASGYQGLAVWGFVLGTLLVGIVTVATVTVSFAQAVLT